MRAAVCFRRLIARGSPRLASSSILYKQTSKWPTEYYYVVFQSRVVMKQQGSKSAVCAKTSANPKSLRAILRSAVKNT